MDKLSKFGYTKVEVLVVVLLLGVVAFITINKTSYAFAIDTTKAVEGVINLIEVQAEEYALDNADQLFSEASTTVITVNDLIDANMLLPNEDGLVTSPDNPEKSFNNNKIRLQYDKEKNKVEASLVE